MTAGVIPQANSGGTGIVNSSPQLDNGVTTTNVLTYAGSGGISAKVLAATSATLAGLLYLGGNTSNPSLPSNVVGFLGPSSASFTSYFLQFPTTAPSTADPFLSCNTPSGNISTCSWSSSSSSGANGALSNLSAVAINTALLPGTTNSIALGSSSEYWSNLFSTAIQCGIAGTTSCVITGAGSTSGTASITWPAVAGTASNPLGFSNNIQLPQGNSYTWSQNGSAPSTGGASIGLVGTGTHQVINPSTILLLPQVKVVAAVNMTSTGVAVTFASWTLPGSAQTWAWQCSGTYTTTTASDTFSLGYTASQAPTGVTGNAIIYSNLTGTSTAGSVTSTTSTANQTMLTGASVSSVTNEPFSTSGVIQASATTGTLVLTGSLTGTSPSGSINPGTTCTLY